MRLAKSFFLRTGILNSVLSVVLISSIIYASSASAEGIGAKAAFVIDSQTQKVLYAKNPDLKLMPASTTKLVTAMCTLDSLNPDTVVTVSRDAAYTPSVAPRLRPGEKITVRNLLYLALMRSINGAAVALAEAASGSENAFTVLMNRKAQTVGAKDTRFVNATGLPAGGQYITARDLTMIMAAALKYPLIKEIINTKETSVCTNRRSLYLRNTNHLLWSDDDLIGGKTGYTRAARHCLVFAASKGDNTIVTALLGEHVRDGLWLDGERLLERSAQVVNGSEQPEIYVSDTSKSPVVLASYTPHKYRHRVYYRVRKAHRVLKAKKLRHEVHKKVHRALANRHKEKARVVAKNIHRHKIAKKVVRHYHRKKRHVSVAGRGTGQPST